MIYKLKCFNNGCSNIREYTNKRSWYNAKRLQSVCLECQKTQTSETLKKKYKTGELKVTPRGPDSTINKIYFKNCPKCNVQIGYTTKYKMVQGTKNNTLCNKCSTYQYKKNFKHIITEESILKMRATKAGYSSWEEYLEKYPKKQQYRREVWKLTYRQPLKTLPNWGKRGRCGVDGAYQLDHITSISEGFSKNISPEVIADMSNLRMLPWKENLLKSNKQ